jgi:hypothetical protein
MFDDRCDSFATGPAGDRIRRGRGEIGFDAGRRSR